MQKVPTFWSRDDWGGASTVPCLLRHGTNFGSLVTSTAGVHNKEQQPYSLGSIMTLPPPSVAFTSEKQPTEQGLLIESHFDVLTRVLVGVSFFFYLETTYLCR